MPPRLFLYANVLFAATISPQGSSRAILELSEARLCTVVSSAFALDETQRNVRAKRPDDLETLKTIEALLQAVPEPDPVLVKWAGEQVPMKDAPILAAAVAAQADMLVTGDRRHFGAFYGLTLKKVRVLTPRDALEELFEMDALTDPPPPPRSHDPIQTRTTCRHVCDVNRQGVVQGRGDRHAPICVA